jgi:hypothetical protein
MACFVAACNDPVLAMGHAAVPALHAWQDAQLLHASLRGGSHTQWSVVKLCQYIFTGSAHTQAMPALNAS